MKYWLEILRKSFVVFPTKIVSVNPFLKLNLEKVFMKTRKSFFIRWLLFRDEEQQQEEQSVIDIEHIQSGKKQRVSSLEEANLWMRQVEMKSLERIRKFAK